MPQNILWLKDISKNDTPKVGGKGANLGEMFNAKMPVPPGFCVTVAVYKAFLDYNRLQNRIEKELKGLNVEDTKNLDSASKKIQKMIIDSKIPDDIAKDISAAYEKINDFVAVRSSATAEDLEDASFAGQQATFLNVRGKKDVLEATKRCWASLFTSRAIYYRQSKGFVHSKVFISVVMQKMVNSDSAGVMFTVNPITKNMEELIIEGNFGLGESVVSGMITPDSYFVDKKTLKPKNISIGTKRIAIYRGAKGKNFEKKLSEKEAEKQVLAETQITEIARLGILIEKHYKKPQDIEWAIEKGKIYITQSRPVTTIK